MRTVWPGAGGRVTGSDCTMGKLRPGERLGLVQSHPRLVSGMEGPEPRAWVLGAFCSLLSCTVVYNNGRQKVLELAPLMCSS